MAPTDHNPYTQILTPEFVISAGCVLFRRLPTPKSTLQVCLLRQTRKDEWQLPKGRKDAGESIEAAALRETFEETGYPCDLLPCTMHTRAPESGLNEPDLVRVKKGVTEPIAITIRDIKHGKKIVWWFIARIKEAEAGFKVEDTQTLSESFESQFVDVGEAEAMLSFQADKDVVKLAIGIVQESDWENSEPVNKVT